MKLKGDGLAIVILQAILLIFSIVAVLLRFYVRCYVRKVQLAFNDWAALLALLFEVGLAAAIFVTATAGMGQHVQQLRNPEEEISKMIKMLLALEILWAAANVSIKLSILNLYVSTATYCIERKLMVLQLHIFTKQNTLFRNSVYAVAAVSISYGVAVVLEVLFLCHPIQYDWDKSIAGRCGNMNQAYIVVGALNLGTDFATFILPMPLLWGLQIQSGGKTKKAGLTLIFGIGLIICVISGLRIWALASWNNADFSYGIGQVAYWSILEPSLGIINCCIPVLGPMFKRLSTDFRSQKQSLRLRENSSHHNRTTCTNFPATNSSELGDKITITKAYGVL